MQQLNTNAVPASTSLSYKVYTNAAILLAQTVAILLMYQYYLAALPGARKIYSVIIIGSEVAVFVASALIGLGVLLDISNFFKRKSKD